MALTKDQKQIVEGSIAHVRSEIDCIIRDLTRLKDRLTYAESVFDKARGDKKPCSA